MPPEPFVLGINYWPRRKAMYWWSDFEVPEVQDEFETIKELGFDLVRIFLLWDDWQSGPDRVDAGALSNLEKVCDIAAGLDLTLDVTPEVYCQDPRANAIRLYKRYLASD